MTRTAFRVHVARAEIPEAAALHEVLSRNTMAGAARPFAPAVSTN